MLRADDLERRGERIKVRTFRSLAFSMRRPGLAARRAVSAICHTLANSPLLNVEQPNSRT